MRRKENGKKLFVNVMMTGRYLRLHYSSLLAASAFALQTVSYIDHKSEALHKIMCNVY